MKNTSLYYYLLPLLLALIIVWRLTGDYGLAWLSVAATAGSMAGSIMLVIGFVLLVLRRIGIGTLIALTMVSMFLAITFSFEEIGFGGLRSLKERFTVQQTKQEYINLGKGKKLWFLDAQGEQAAVNFDVQGKREFTRSELYEILSQDLKQQLNRSITVYSMYSNITDPIAGHERYFLYLNLSINNDEGLPYGGYLVNGVMKANDTTWAINGYANNQFQFIQYGQSGDLADGIGNFIDREEIDLKGGQWVTADKSKLKFSINDKKELDGYIYVRGNDDQWCAYRDPLVDDYGPINTVDFSYSNANSYTDHSSITNKNILYCGTDHDYVYQILPKSNPDRNSLQVIVRRYQKAL